MSERAFARRIECGPELEPRSPELAPQRCLVQELNHLDDPGDPEADLSGLTEFIIGGDFDTEEGTDLACNCSLQCNGRRIKYDLGDEGVRQVFEVEKLNDVDCPRGHEIQYAEDL